MAIRADGRIVTVHKYLMGAGQLDTQSRTRPLDRWVTTDMTLIEKDNILLRTIKNVIAMVLKAIGINYDPYAHIRLSRVVEIIEENIFEREDDALNTGLHFRCLLALNLIKAGHTNLLRDNNFLMMDPTFLGQETITQPRFRKLQELFRNTDSDHLKVVLLSNSFKYFAKVTNEFLKAAWDYKHAPEAIRQQLAIFYGRLERAYLNTYLTPFVIIAGGYDEPDENVNSVQEGLQRIEDHLNPEAIEQNWTREYELFRNALGQQEGAV